MELAEIFELVYQSSPKELKSELIKSMCLACHWNKSQFWTKRKGLTKIRFLESQKIITTLKSFITKLDGIDKDLIETLQNY